MDKLKNLKKLKQLLDENVITFEEYSIMKDETLGSVIKENSLSESGTSKQVDKPIKKTSPIFIAVLIVALIFIGFKFVINDSKNKNNQVRNSENNSILSKKENLRTYDDWEKIADYHSDEFYECAKELILEDRWREIGDICTSNHRNKWVLFRDGLDDNSNLNYDQREKLKDYWNKLSDSTIEKIKKSIDENERVKRPNRYN